MIATAELNAERVAAATDSFRRHILEALLTQGELSVTALAEDMPISRQAVSKHLANLLRLGLVEKRHAGREALFCVCADVLDDVVQQIQQSVMAWERRLQALKKTAESS